MRPLEIIDERTKKTMLKCLVAENWNELTKKQLANYCTWFYINKEKLFELNEEGNKPILKDGKLFEQIKHLLMMSLLDLKLAKYERLPDETKFRLVNESGILDFLWTENTRTKAPFRKINMGSLIHTKWYYTPGEMLNGCTFEEFILMDKYYMAFVESENENYLNSLCTVMCRPVKSDLNPNDPKWNGDWREPFSSTLATNREDKWNTISIGERLSIFRYFDGCRRKLKAICPYLLQESAEVAVKENSSGNEWIDILHSIAGGKFGTFEETKHSPYLEVLVDMDKAIRDYENRKRDD